MARMLAPALEIIMKGIKRCRVSDHLKGHLSEHPVFFFNFIELILQTFIFEKFVT